MELVSPEISEPLICHWYVGVPPNKGVAVKVTLVPEHIIPDGLAAIVTSASSEALTVIVIVFEVAGEPVTHVVRDEVITQVITSPFASAAEV